MQSTFNLIDKKSVFLNMDVEADKAKFFAVSSMSPVDALKVLGNPNYIVIDEAQRHPEISKIIKGWFDSDLRKRKGLERPFALLWAGAKAVLHHLFRRFRHP